jgi:phage terminase large subunit-like protein
MQRRPTPKIEDDCVSLYLRYQPQILAFEANFAQHILCSNICQKILKKGQLPRVKPYVQKWGGGESKVRIRIGLSPLLQQARLHIKKSAGGQLLRKQLLEFPNGAHDDGPDACEICVQAINELLLGKRQPSPLILKA